MFHFAEQQKKTGILFVLGSFCHLIAHQRLLSWEFDHLASLEALTLGGDGWMEIDRNTWDVGEILVNLASFNAQLNQNSTKTPIKRQLNLSQCLILVKFWILFLGRRIPGPRARHFGSKLEFLSMGRRILFKRRRENCLTDLWRLFSKFSHCFFRPFWRFYLILGFFGMSFHQDTLDLQLIDSKQLRQALQVGLGSHWRGSDSRFRKKCLIPASCSTHVQRPQNFGVKALALEFYGANYGLKVGFLWRQNDTNSWRSCFFVVFC